MGMKPELVREVERDHYDIVRLTSTRGSDFGSKLLEEGWTLFCSGVVIGEMCWAGVSLLIGPVCHQ